MPRKTVVVDFSKDGNIKSAERKKSRLENQGYNLKKTEQTGFNTFKLTYKKSPRRLRSMT